VCQKTLWSMTEPRGDLPCVRIGRRVLYDRRDLLAWIDRRKGGAR
jgi:predicted DNA-binding transcriptional regulator AlpA